MGAPLVKKKIFQSTIVLFLSIMSLAVTAADSNVDKRAIRFGSVAMDTPAVMHKRLTPLTQYISKSLQRPVILQSLSTL